MRVMMVMVITHPGQSMDGWMDGWMDHARVDAKEKAVHARHAPLQYSSTVAKEEESISKTSKRRTTRGWDISRWMAYSRVACFM